MRRLALLLAACALGGGARAETVDEAIAAAVARDPDLAAAAAERDAAQARLDQARAASNPTVAISGTIGVGRLDPRGFFGIPAKNVVPRAVQVTAEMPLYTGGRLAAGRVQARAGLAIGNAALAARQRQLELDVASAYADAYAARKSRDVALRSAEDMKETERQAGLMFRAGATARTEFLQAQSRRAEAQAAAARAEGDLQSRLRALRHLPACPKLRSRQPPPRRLGREPARMQSRVRWPGIQACCRLMPRLSLHKLPDRSLAPDALPRSRRLGKRRRSAINSSPTTKQTP